MHNTANNRPDKITKVLFILYLVVLSWILLFKLGVPFSYRENRNVNLIPYHDMFAYGTTDMSQVIMNMLIFMPMGTYTALVMKRWSFIGKLFFFMMTSLMVEVLQYAWRLGAFDSTDVLNNTLGATVGLMLFKVLQKAFTDPAQTQKIINRIAAIGTVVMIVLLILLKLNKLPIRYQ